MNTTITFAGNLTDDPELRYTPKGKAVATFTVAVNRRVQDAEGQWVDAPATFHDVEVWGSEAENIVESLTKGNGAVVHGQVKTDTWEYEGKNHRRDVVVVSERYGAIGAWLRFATAQPHKTSRTNTQEPGETAPPF